MFHLCAYAQQATTVTTQVDLPAINDQVMSIRNGHFVPAADMQVLGVYALGAHAQQIQMLTPKINTITPNFVHPIDIANLPTTFGRGMDLRKRPYTIKASEELRFLSTNAVTTSTNNTVLAWLGVTPPQQTMGEVYRFRWSSTTAAVAIAWTDLTVTFQNSLPAGNYAVIGGGYYATNAIAWRVIFQGQYWRAGGMGIATEPLAVWEPFDADYFDTFGIFNTNSLPIIEVFNGSTDAVHAGYLDIVKVS